MECGALQSGQVGGPPTHCPLLQESCEVHTSPSLHGPTAGVCQHPVAGVQPSSVQTLASSQLVGGPAVQTPDWQVSVAVQAFPSLQLAPLDFGGLEHNAVVVLQTPAA
jgi:hypothetical protein